MNTTTAAPTNQHQPSTDTKHLHCTAPDCGYTLHVHQNRTIKDPDQFWPEQFRRHHGDQYEPGRAPDVAVDWVVSACCSVCEDGIGDIEVNDSDSLRCKDCGTTWGMDGTAGERDEEAAQ
jgi:hypothetical protein